MILVDAGFDLHLLDDSFPLEVGQNAVVHVQAYPSNPALKETEVGLLCGRSGLFINHGIVVPQVGVVDPPFTGVLKTRLMNMGDATYYFEKNERVAQLVVLPLSQFVVRKTNRGNSGYGSSGRF